MNRVLAPKTFMIVAGLVGGALASFMTYLGNPANMGLCIACFTRDIAGALGLHRAATVQYLRPEIMGIALGAFLSALIFGEFRARGGSAPLVRFFLGAFFMIGALVFLGCPVRVVLRLAGGDLNAVAGLAGVMAGALAGIYFLKQGFNLGRWQPTYTAAGWLMPLFMLGLLLLAIFRPAFILFSKEGPGAAHALLGVSLVAGLIIGFLAQRTRMCFVGGWRDLFLVKDTYLFSGIAAFFVGALLVNAIIGKIHIGFMGQPAAQTNQLWNFLGMALAGLTATLMGGCPLRQTVLASEGDTDAGVAIMGMLAGTAFAHNFQLASSPQGPSAYGPVAVIIGLVFAVAVGLFMRESVD
ncbi:YedE family putative selenium transporter [Moorella sulfitireducens (nom. illeg.)]|uniref:YedE family putative selenium transporter n=1 Tax=Neomoorella sulfitireducens TaxID=2972948 RepID=UPI0021ABC67A|nr:YedE family putative selenium transporter [Moorella sulfitireducens]